MTLEAKWCPQCEFALPLTAFSVRADGRAQSWCGSCKNAARRKGGQHPRQRSESAADRYIKVRGKYGLSPKQQDDLHAQHAGRCAICGGPPTRSRNRLDIDHCHRTGRVRGLLCSNCNRSIGLMSDDPDRLRAAADYLEA